MATKPSRVISYLDWLLPIKVTQNFDHVILQDHMTNQNYYISMTYNEEFPFKKHYDLLIMWFGKVTSQIKYFISPIARDQ